MRQNGASLPFPTVELSCPESTTTKIAKFQLQLPTEIADKCGMVVLALALLALAPFVARFLVGGVTLDEARFLPDDIYELDLAFSRIADEYRVA